MSKVSEAALALDFDFALLERLSEQLERLPLETENGLEQARKLLSHFSEAGERIGTGVQALAQSLDDARTRAEKAAAIVTARANLVQDRVRQSDELVARFKALGETARQVTVAVTELRQPSAGALSKEQIELLTQHLPKIDSQLGSLLEESRKLQEDARVANHRTIERNADSVAQSLRSVRDRLSGFVH